LWGKIKNNNKKRKSFFECRGFWVMLFGLKKTNLLELYFGARFFGGLSNIFKLWVVSHFGALNF
jgi:hypothetical protein